MSPGVSNPMSIKRINREIADLKKEDLGDITLTPDEGNLYLWRGSLPGPQGSPYEGGVFGVEIHLAADYPFSAPKVTFTTRIYHMNISERGGICIDILKQNWSPALSIFKVMLSLSSLLTDPNPQDPLVPSIATQYVRNRKQHDTTARQWVELYARPKPKPKPTQDVQVEIIMENGGNGGGSVKAKGKRKAGNDVQSSGNASSSSSTSGAMTGTRNTQAGIDDTPIVIEDSDDEVANTRSRQNGPTAKRRKRDVGSDVATESGGRSSRGRMKPVQLGDVIVIDD